MSHLKKYLPLIVLAVVLAVVLASGITKYLGLSTLKENGAELRAFIAANALLALVIYVGVYALATAISIPGAAILTLAGGYLFGTWVGGVATVIGATIGAVMIFYAVRTSLGASLRARAEASGGRLKAVIDGVRDGAFGYILTLRLIPLAPFWLVNVAAALAHAPLGAYALATFIGIIPGTFIFCGIGAGIGEVLARDGTPDLGIIFEPKVFLPLLALGLLTLGTTLYQRFVARKGGKA
jgi:uncharacterized membrane protein YdjX (TVP38/TMEM64 family)